MPSLARYARAAGERLAVILLRPTCSGRSFVQNAAKLAVAVVFLSAWRARGAELEGDGDGVRA